MTFNSSNAVRIVVQKGISILAMVALVFGSFSPLVVFPQSALAAAPGGYTELFVEQFEQSNTWDKWDDFSGSNNGSRETVDNEGSGEADNFTVGTSGKGLLLEGDDDSNPDEGMEREIATKGYSALYIEYSRAWKGTEAADTFVAQYSFDGEPFINLESQTLGTVTSHTLVGFSVSNPERHTKLTLRFYINGSDNNDNVGIDDVRVYGQGGPLFYDGFESGNFTVGGWTTSGGGTPSVISSNGSSWTDNNTSATAHAAKLHGSGSADPDDHIIKAFSTAGYENIKLRFAQEHDNTGPGDNTRILISTTSPAAWTPVMTISGDQNSSYDSEFIDLSAFSTAVNNNPNFQLKIENNTHQGNDTSFIDDVVIWGDVYSDDTPPSVPQNGAPHLQTLTTNTFTFTWDTSTDDQPGDITYEFQSSLNPAETGGVLTTDVWQSGVLATPSILSSGASDGVWYWQVRAKDVAGNTSDWSSIWNVTLDTQGLSFPIHVSPADNSTLTAADFVIADWTDVSDSGPVTYYYQSANSPATTTGGAFVSPVYTSGALSASEIPTPGTPEGVWYWHVRAVDNAGNSTDWTDAWKVTVDNTPDPVTVTILKFIDGEHATPDNTDGASFPMYAVFPGGEGAYALSSSGFNNPNAYEATTSLMPYGSDYSTWEVTSSEGQVLPIGTPCAANKYRLVGYKTGDTLSAAEGADLSTDVPAFTVLTTSKFVIVINEDCDDLLPSEIIQPTVDEETNGVTELEARYLDENGDGNDGVQWAVRAGTCAANTGTVFGNVDGRADPFIWDSKNFLASMNTTELSNGMYCFVFNPTEDSGSTNQRLTRMFTVNNPVDEPEPTVTVHIYKYLKQDESETFIPNTTPITYYFPMASSWSSDNLGTGTGTYTLGSDYGHPNEGLNYTASTSVMTAPADYATHEITTDENEESLVLAPNAPCRAGMYRLVGYRSGDTLANAESGARSLTAPSFEGLSADKYVIVVNEDCDDVIAAAGFSDVTICKRDDAANELSGWTLALTDTNGQNISVPSNSSAGNNALNLVSGVQYLAQAAGTFLNGNNGVADADYYSTNNWSTYTDGTPTSINNLDLQVGGQFVAWGPYSPNHLYSYVFTQVANGALNFRVFDGQNGIPTQSWYTDNNGSLTVNVAKYYSGVTGENGCVTFEQVAQGTYIVDEVMQDGWTNVTGVEGAVDAGQIVTVDGPTETFTLVNHNGNIEHTETSQTIIVKMEDLATTLSDVIASSTTWFFYNDETDVIDNSLGSFVTGPGTAPVGTGSAQMSVIGTERRNIATYQFAGTPLADIDALTFSTYASSTADGDLGLTERAPYLNFNIDFDNSDTWQKRLSFVPSVNGVVVPDTWQTWNATGSALWTWSGYAANGNTWPDNNTNQYRTWDDIVASFPNAETRSTDSWFGFRVGEPYSNGFTGNVDGFAITINDGLNATTTTFDFEPTAVSTEEEEREDETGGPSITTTSNTPGNGPIGFFGGFSGGGSVLGAATTTLASGEVCGDPLLTTYLRRGKNNDPEEVKLLQEFLNRELGLSIPVTGFFGPLTEAAVKTFQLKYAEEILGPWVAYGLPNSQTATGYVYKTTQRWINLMHCKSLSIPMPQLP